MQPRTQISVLVTLVAAAVLLLIGVTAVVSIEPLASRAMTLLPTVGVASLSVAALLGWYLPPRLLARNWDYRREAQPIRVRHGGTDWDRRN